MSPEQLERVDIALMNLLCAQGLPGADGLDIEQSLATLDQWAAKVKEVTDRHLYRVRDPQYAEHYKHSEAIFRMEMICQVLQEDFGVHYNRERLREIDFTNSKDLFIHGMVSSKNGGTCVSMPVIYTAVARRLGYPVKLVEAKQHLFCRWDGNGERWNIEATDSGGMDSFPDEYYKTWPQPIDDIEVARGEYLKSLTPAEELAVFLSARGHCLLDNGRLHEAQVVYARSHQLHPQSRDHLGFFANAVQREMPKMAMHWAGDGFPAMPQAGRNVEDDIRRVHAINQANRQRMEDQMQKSRLYPATGGFVGSEVQHGHTGR